MVSVAVNILVVQTKQTSAVRQIFFSCFPVEIEFSYFIFFLGFLPNVFNENQQESHIVVSSSCSETKLLVESCCCSLCT